ncbi:MAG: hypothetical protein AB8G26_17935, partial [Ilumatobacter sp.]
MDLPECPVPKSLLRQLEHGDYGPRPAAAEAPLLLLVGVRQAADMLSISRSSVYQTVDAGELRPIRWVNSWGSRRCLSRCL